MNRVFLGLAVSNLTILVVAFGSGLFASAEPKSPEAFWPGLHLLLGLLAMLTCLLVHSVVYTYFLGTGKWIGEVVRVYKLPATFEARSKRNKRRAFPFEFWSMMIVGAAVWLGGAADTMEGAWPIWHLLISAVAIGFNLGAHFVEYAVIQGQARLILEVKQTADRLRASSETGGAASAASAPASSGASEG